MCGCNGVCKGTIVKAIQERGLFTLDDVQNTKASAAAHAPASSEQISPRPSAAPGSRRIPNRKSRTLRL